MLEISTEVQEMARIYVDRLLMPQALIISPPNAINAAYANIYRFGVRFQCSVFRHERQNQWN